MPEIKGMLSIDQLKQKVRNEEIDTILVVFTDIYGRFMGKRLDSEFFLDSTVEHGTHACNYLLTVDMKMEVIEGYNFANWEKGYGDFHLVPDLSTLRTVSWLEKTAMVICDVKNTQDHSFIPQAPRSLLRKQLDSTSSMGFSAMAASELEYYLFENSFKGAARNGYQNLEPAGWYIEDYNMLQGTRGENFHGAARHHLKNSGIPVENSKGEAGIGQHELNIRFSDILTMADRHCIFKQCLKEVADQKEVSVSFMAKYTDEQAGSSCHLHLSLWKKGRNAFQGNQSLGEIKCSNIFRWFLGGWMQHVPEIMVFYAPTINSYKRYQACSWAPTRIAWSYDNRTAGFRIVGQEESLRIECRIPGADCNPYLAFAAALASGLDGIKNQIEPPPSFKGDIYSADQLPRFPISLRQALGNFKQSAFIKEKFGPEIVEHYAHFFSKELELFDNAVTDWERKRYFEQI